MQLKGAFTALITPFKEEGVDLLGLAHNVRYQIESGIDGLVVLGTTGENVTMTTEEQKDVIQTVVAEAKGKVTILVGTGSLSTQETIEKTKLAKELGADAALVVTPYYNKPTQEGLFRHFEALVTAVDFPIVVYNIPGRTGAGLELATIQRIAKLPHIIGIKETSGTIHLAMQLLDPSIELNLSVLSGDDFLTYPFMTLGALGVVSVLSNLLPKEISELVHAALDKDFEKARKLHYELYPLFKAIMLETNPIPIKEVMNLCNMPAGVLRLPLCTMQKENKDKLNAVLQAYLTPIGV